MDNTHDSLQRENQAVVQHRPVFPLDVIRKFIQYFSIETKIRNQAEAELEAEFQGLPSVPFHVILKATQKFSDDKIIGKGSSGVVYKGQLDDGELIAVKRFSRRLYGTIDDFINEIALLSNLQHKNVVKVLGYCIERDEKLLIYEFMSNRSLYHVLYDSGYIAPENVMHVQLSVKTDVYSFGILLQEIITGKKNADLFVEREMFLQQYVWKLWCEGQALDLIDPALKQSCENYNNELMRFIHIGLLCIQEDPTDRPTMSSVVVMLASDDVKLPVPKVTFQQPQMNDWIVDSTSHIAPDELSGPR